MTPTLTVSLPAIAHNYKLLSSQLGSGRCGAAVKANAYGLGVAAVAPALAKAGCNDFFVATLEEGIELRGILKKSTIYVINSIAKNELKTFSEYNLTPVLNTPEQVKLWANYAGITASVLQIDTGMNRLGLTELQLTKLSAAAIKKANIKLVMSHLACADTPEHAMNKAQLERFKMAKKIPAFAGMTKGTGMTLEWSLANSSGIFLGKPYHFDLARPGCALYGINPTPHLENPMRAVAELMAPILQVRDIAKKGGVGYGETYIAKKGDRIATVGIGYADGFFRHLGNQSYGFIGGVCVPVVGRVSMDMVMVDVSFVPPQLLDANPHVEFIGPSQSVDAFASIADTIGYEVFTRLGSRVKRIYK